MVNNFCKLFFQSNNCLFQLFLNKYVLEDEIEKLSKKN